MRTFHTQVEQIKHFKTSKHTVLTYTAGYGGVCVRQIMLLFKASKANPPNCHVITPTPPPTHNKTCSPSLQLLHKLNREFSSLFKNTLSVMCAVRAPLDVLISHTKCSPFCNYSLLHMSKRVRIALFIRTKHNLLIKLQNNT